MSPTSNCESGWEAFNEKNYDLAAARFGLAVLEDSEQAGAYYGLALVCACKRDYGKAITFFTEAIRLNPDDPDPYSYRAVAYGRTGEEEKSIGDYTEVLRLDPANSAALVNRGTAHSRRSNHDQAIADFAEAIRRDPANAEAWYGRGLAYAGKGASEEAIADFTELIRLHPDYFGAFVNRATLHALRSEHAAAAADFSQAIRINPAYAPAYYNRGVAHGNLGEYGKAVADLTEAIRLDPDDGDAYSQLAWILATCPESGRRSGALAAEYARKACELSGWRDAAALDTLAASHAECGDFQAAVQWQTRALDLPYEERSKREKAVERLRLYERNKPCREG